MSNKPTDPHDPDRGMHSDQPDDDQNHNEWQDMLHSVFGDATAEEIEQALKAQGIDPLGNIGNVLSGKNFTLITQQIRDMLGSSGTGPVNWKIAEQVARETITNQHMDKLTAADGDAARQALRTASLWLDTSTAFNPSRAAGLAWTRLDFVAHCLPTMRRLLEPVGANISRAFFETFTEQMNDLPEQIKGMFGNPQTFLNQITGTMIGAQYGSALTALAAHSFGSTDAGLPLIAGASSALVPANVAEFSQGLNIPPNEVMLYVATRENAASRLYSKVTWLRPRILDTVAAFAQEIDIDSEAIEEQLRDALSRQEAIATVDLSSVLTLELSEHQQELLDRLVHLLSLVEGWVSHTASLAVAPHLPNCVALQEMFARRYATDNPAKAVWEAQLGMELKPRLLREAAAFWQMAYSRLGIDKRDGLWDHPDFLPTSEALKDPESFFTQPEPSDIEAELDSFLEDLFNEAEGAIPDSSEGGAETSDKPENNSSDSEKGK